MELSSIEETNNLSKKISGILKSGDVIFLFGEIGSGKTTFTRFLINNLEQKNKSKKSDVLSPTFNIVYHYSIGNKKILHYDLYRLKNNRDILELGIFENLKQRIKIIEWPELIKLKPKDRIEIIFKYLKKSSSRKVKILGFGKWREFKFNEI